jgi:Secretion system C-terminal sorting domain
MKKFTSSTSKISLFLLLISILQTKVFAQTTLAAGDIAFSGCIGREVAVGDRFSIVLLKAITANTVIKFTDFGWRNVGNRFYSDNATESELTFTSNASYSAGTEISIGQFPVLPITNPITYTNEARLNSNTSAGTVVYTTGNLPFIGTDGIQRQFFAPMSFNGINGDQVFAYQGTFASPTFITGIHMNVYVMSAGGDPTTTNATSWDGDVTGIYLNSNTSAKPAALTTGTNAIWIGVEGDASSELGNARFNCSAVGVNISTVNAARTSLNNKLFWLANDTDPSGFGPPVLPTGCSYVTNVAATFTTQPFASSSCASLSASFNVVTDQSGVTFQWQEAATVGFTSPTNIAIGGLYSISSTTNSSTLTISDNTTKNGKFYRCVATNSGALQTTSSIVSLTATANTFPALGSNLSATATIGIGNASYFFASGCRLLSKVVPGNLTGSVTVEEWVESTVPTVSSVPFLQRHYQITPTTGNAGTITLFYSQPDFTAYNAFTTSTLDNLPTGPSDATGIANFRLTKYNGSGDFTGLPASYTNGSSIIDPIDSDIKWNADASRWEVTFPVTSFSGFTAQSAVAAPLPVKLVAFNAKINEEKLAQLNWKVAEQSDIQAYEVEKSFDPSNFKTIGKVIANKATITDYQFLDADLAFGQNYYRLKIFEQNGDFNFSKIISVNKTLDLTSKLFPNPVTDYLNITEFEKPITGQAELFDSQGKSVMKIQIIDKQPISMKNITEGVYFLRFGDGNTYKFLKK